jgi:hypothetical protein
LEKKRIRENSENVKNCWKPSNRKRAEDCILKGFNLKKYFKSLANRELYIRVLKGFNLNNILKDLQMESYIYV